MVRRDSGRDVEIPATLEHQDAFREAVIDNAGEGLCVCHEIPQYPFVQFTMWNRRMTEIIGYSMDDINRLGWYQTVYQDADTSARAAARMAEMRVGNDMHREEWEVTRADGESRVVSISTSLLQSEDGASHVLALMQDVTDRKRAETLLAAHRDDLERVVHERTIDLERANEQLRQEIESRNTAEAALQRSDSLLRAAVDSLPFQLFVLDETGHYAMQNKALLESWGDIIGKRPDDVAPSQDVLARWKANNVRAFAGEIVREDVEFDFDGETVYHHDVIVPVRDEGRVTGLIGLVMDIGDRRRAELAHERLEARIRHSEKIEAIGTLAGGVAHDFNNLLMAIQGNVSLLLSELPADDSKREYLDAVGDCVRSGARLTGQLLGYARKGKYELRPRDINVLVARTAETLARTRRSLEVVTELTDGHAVCVVDEGQIEQLLLNLLVNAADAMPIGGKVVVRTALVTREQSDADAGPANFVSITVADEGIGMDESTQQRIFEPFFTTKEMGRGTGMGLASAYGIVANHGGHVEVQSQLGHGSTFTVYLPASTKPATAQRVSEREEPAAGCGRLMLVDDEPLILMATGKLLRRLGYQVVEAAGGEAAVALLSDEPDGFDLVVLDMVMPGMGGGAAFDAMRELNPSQKILLCSGYSVDSGAQDILARGCDGFMQKPFDIDQLITKVRSLTVNQ